MDLNDLHARAGINYLGMFRSSNPNWTRAVRGLSQPVTAIAVDRGIERRVKSQTSELIGRRDNRSVTEPEWVAQGLARYGCPLHAVNPEFSSSEYEFTVSELGACSCRRSARNPRGANRVAGTTSSGQRAGSSQASLSRMLGSDDEGNSDKDRRASVSREQPERQPRLRAGRSWNARDYGDAFSATISVAGDPNGGRKPYPLDEVVDRFVHMSHYAGAPYFTKNRDAIGKALPAAQRIWSGDRGFDPYLFGRRVQPGKTGPKTRLVWMASLTTSIVGSAFSKRVSQNLERKRPFAIGLRSIEKGALVSEFQSRFRYVYSLDFSAYDSSAPAFMLDDVFRVLRTHLDLDEEARSVWDRYVSDFIHSRIITPDGSIFQKHKGIPSGSAFTSLVGSVLNLLLLNYVLIRTTGAALKSDRVLIQGDDAIFASDHRYDLGKLASYAAELGFNLSVEKSQVTDSHQEVHSLQDCVHFLGHYWRNGWPHRPHFEILQRMVFTERHKPRSDKESLIRFYAYLTDAWESWEIYTRVFREEDAMTALTRCLDELGDLEIDVGEVDLPGQLRYHAAVISEAGEDPLPVRGLALGVLPLIF